MISAYLTDMDFRTLLLQTKELVVDNVYQGGRNGNTSDDPLSLLTGVGNQGGFRFNGTLDLPTLVILSSNQKDLDWPDNLDKETGIYTYYGDNKHPGKDLHDTKRAGNSLLKKIFELAHGGPLKRQFVPPILVFANAGSYRDVIFLGLAVPGAQGLDQNSDLVALWKMKDGKRFQNYQAKFTILNTGPISRAWLDEARSGKPHSTKCPKAWELWSKKGIYTPLEASRSVEYRDKEQQIPTDADGLRTIKQIHEHFANEPVKFEKCAGMIARLMLKDIVKMDLTRPSRDGGRDAVGTYKIGEGPSSVLVEFALEAKCYALNNAVGVKELSRLISRLRHRQFGIFVTTSYIALQAYQEIKEDQHPIVVISAVDIVNLLKKIGVSYGKSLSDWLNGVDEFWKSRIDIEVV